MKKLTFECDTCVELFRTSNGIYAIDPTGENEESFFLKTIMDNNVTYKVIDPNGPGGGWPIIEYTGTIDELSGVLPLLSTTGQTSEEVKEILENWDEEESFEDYLFENILG